MLIWVLAIVLMASLAGLGYRQGAIRVAFSFVGILLGALLAPPLGHLLRRPFMAVGLKNPVLLWVLGPLVVFFIFSLGAKAAALAMHQKVDVYHKYKAGELRFVLWERLNRRLGLCLGLANGALYFILISWVIWAFSYWTIQMATSENDPRSVRILNSLGEGLQSSGMSKVAKAVDRLPKSYYDIADVTGVVYHNPLSQARLEHYPAFLGLEEKPEIQEIMNDKDLTEMWMQQKPVMDLANNPKVQAVLLNSDVLKESWDTVESNLSDLLVYLQTGQSPKYASETILGRWNFNVGAALGFQVRAKPYITSSEMQKLKRAFAPAFAKTVFLATTDHQVIIKELPRLSGAMVVANGGTQTYQGQWSNADGKYQISVTGGGDSQTVAATADSERLVVKWPGMDLVFDRED